MARTNTLANFLTDVANAIRTKKGTQATISASTFDTEILNLPSGTYQTKNITISANGSQTITPDQGYDAIDEITITTQVPQKQLQSKTYNFTTNQTIELTPDTGYDGFDIITLTINVPSSQINNQDKTITQNGVYTADQGYTGLGTVNVNVSGGDVPVKLFTTEQEMEADPNPEEGDLALVYGSSLTNWDGTTPITSLTFPSTVVLSTAYTDNAWIYGSAYGPSSRIQLNGSIDNSGMYITIDMMYDYKNIEYTSSDGITYTKTSGDDTVVFSDTPMQFDMWEWDAVCGNFMKTGGLYYGGLYEYGPYTDVSKFKPVMRESIILDGLTATWNGTYKNELIEKSMLISIANTIKEDIGSGWTKTIYACLKDNKWNIFFPQAQYEGVNDMYIYCITCMNNNNVLTPVGIGSNQSSSTSGNPKTKPPRRFEVDLVNQTYVDKGIVSVTEYHGTSYYFSYADLLPDSIMYVLNLSEGTVTKSPNVIVYLDTTSHFISSPAYETNYTYDKYLIAPTQLTLADPAQILTDIIGYGSGGIIEGDGSINTTILNNTSSEYFMNKYLNLSPVISTKVYDYNLFTSNITLNEAIYCKETSTSVNHTVSIQKLLSEPVITSTSSNPEAIYFINRAGTRIAYVDFTNKEIKVCDIVTKEVLGSTSYLYDYRQITYIDDGIYYMYKDTNYYVYKKLDMNTLSVTTVITTDIPASRSIDRANYGTCTVALKNRYLIGNPYSTASSTTYRALWLYDTVTGYSGIIDSYSNTGNTSDIYCCTDESSVNNNLYVFRSYRNTSGTRYSIGYRYDLVNHTKTQLYNANLGSSSWGPNPTVGSVGWVANNYVYYCGGRSTLYGGTPYTYKYSLSTGLGTSLVSDVSTLYLSNLNPTQYYSVTKEPDITIGEKSLANYKICYGSTLQLVNDILVLSNTTTHYLPMNIAVQNVQLISVGDYIYYNGNTILLPEKYELSDVTDFDIMIFNTKNKLPDATEDNKSYAMVLYNYANTIDAIPENNSSGNSDGEDIIEPETPNPDEGEWT